MKNRLPKYLLITAITTGAFTVALGVVVLVGWYTGNKVLIQVLPMFVPMQYNTALGFVLCGSGMLLGIFNNRHITYSMGILVILLGSLTFLEYKTVDNGTDAIKIVESEDFDLVLCDLAMRMSLDMIL